MTFKLPYDPDALTVEDFLTHKKYRDRLMEMEMDFIKEAETAANKRVMLVASLTNDLIFHLLKRDPDWCVSPFPDKSYPGHVVSVVNRPLQEQDRGILEILMSYKRELRKGGFIFSCSQYSDLFKFGYRFLIT